MGGNCKSLGVSSSQAIAISLLQRSFLLQRWLTPNKLRPEDQQRGA
jgi:hypothetical protein